MVAIWVVPIAKAQAAIRFDLPAQPLADSLRAVGSQANINLLFDPPLVAGYNAPALHARLTADQALSRLLAGTKIQHEFLNEKTVVFALAGSVTLPTSQPQDGGASTTGQSQSEPPPPEPPQSELQSEVQTFDEIIVTAQKREENVREVPVSISVIGETQLEDLHATQLTDYAAYVPGFQVDSQGAPGRTILSLRGIATLGGGATVGTYIGETPVGSSNNFASAGTLGLDLLPYDIERIEVLRGPQGTLYGASTMGGLLKYVPRAPDLENFELRAGADTFTIADSEDLGWGGRIGINVPLVEGKLALRASYAEQDTPGYIDNAVTGEEDQNAFSQQGGRMALLWQASEDVSLELSGMWQSVDADGIAVARVDYPSLDPVGDGRSNVNVFAEPFDNELAYYAATLNWALGWADFVSAASYSDTTTRTVQDFSERYGVAFPVLRPGTPEGLSRFQSDLELEKWTQEFRLSSPTGGQVEWLLGAFYTKEDSELLQTLSAQSLDGAPIPQLTPFYNAALPATYEETAVFGHLTYKFSERFDLGLGARWAHNEQEFAQISSGVIVRPGTFPGSSSENVWTYSLAPRFHLSEDAMLYGRIARGYRPGGPNVVLSGNEPPTVDAETLVSYELGLKAEFLDRRALVDVALFHIDWDDIQLNVREGGASYRDNAGKARSRGIELSSVLRPTDGLQLGFNATYTDATLTEVLPTFPTTSGQAGDQLPQIPQWSGALTADYNFPLHGGWMGHVGAGYRYVGERLSSLESAADSTRTASYSATDLNAAISNERWILRLFVKNVFDKHADLTRTLFLDALNAPAYISAVQLQPRTVGVAVDVRF